MAKIYPAPVFQDVIVDEDQEGAPLFLKVEPSVYGVFITFVRKDGTEAATVLAEYYRNSVMVKGWKNYQEMEDYIVSETVVDEVYQEQDDEPELEPVHLTIPTVIPDHTEQLLERRAIERGNIACINCHKHNGTVLRWRAHLNATPEVLEAGTQVWCQGCGCIWFYGQQA